MDLYFAPLACSMAARIALYEAGAAAGFIEVDTRTKRTLDGTDYIGVNPIGQVPALRTDTGEILTENAAVLQWIADTHPDAALAPAGGLERARLHQWLCFIGTELHKALFLPLLDPKVPAETKTQSAEKGESRLRHLNTHLEGREFLLDSYSIADAYLFTVLNWKIATPVDLAKWPNVEAYYNRLKARPAIAKALREEFALYAAEQKRRKAA